MNKLSKVLLSFLSIIIIGMLVVTFYVDTVPKRLTFTEIKQSYINDTGKTDLKPTEQFKMPPGYATAEAFYYSLDKVMNKRGGYIMNDILPPFVFLDNMPSYERGAINALKRTSTVFAEKMAYVSSNTINDNLQKAVSSIGFNPNKWGVSVISNTEKEFNRALTGFKDYKDSLVDNDPQTGQFVARANDLSEMVDVYMSLLKDRNALLKSSTGVEMVMFDYDVDPSLTAKPQTKKFEYIKTPYSLVDDNFYEALGTSIVIYNEMIGLRYDFYKVLKDKNALADFDQALAYMNKATRHYSSLIVLDGEDRGWVSNHSASLSSDIATVNNNLNRVRELLKDG